MLVIIGLTYRSYWVLAITGGSLAALIIWLQGITNLIGLKADLILSLIVPIAMISFGVDFMFHAVGRYRENRMAGQSPPRAFTVGLAAVAGALVLALASDSAAFLANVSAGIESIIQFGLGAAIALTAAFLLLGIVTPLAIAKVEERIGTPRRSRRRAVLSVLASVGAGMLAMASVLLSVFILPVGGPALLAVYLLVAIALPYRLARRVDGAEPTASRASAGRTAALVGSGVTAVARSRAVLVPLAIALTLGAAILATKVSAEFDVKDFFSADADFVAALDELDEHGGDQAGEPADVYIEADLVEPSIVAAIAGFVDKLEALDGDRFARGDDGRVLVEPGVVGVLEDVLDNPAARQAVAATGGVELTDLDDNAIPDTREQLAAAYTTTRTIGIPFDGTRLASTPDEVRSALWVADDLSAQATVIEVQLPGSRAVENISAASRPDRSASRRPAGNAHRPRP